MASVFLSKFQKRIIALIAVITVINFIDRSALSFVIEPLGREFGITNQEFGIIAAAFGIGYMFTTFFGGIVVDRFGTVGTWAISAILWSAATMMLALGKGFWSFFWIRVFLGLAEGLHFPALVRTVVDWIPVQWRARATALGLFGIPFASIIGAPFITTLIEMFNWRVMFVVLGGVGIFWGLLWMFHFRKHPKYFFACASVTADTKVKRKTPWKAILLNKTFIASCLIYFAVGYTVFFGLMWLPGYLSQVHGVSLKATGLLVLPPWITAAGFMIAGGWMADALWKKTQSLRISRSYLIGGGLLFSGLCFIPIIFSQGLVWDLVWMSLGLGSAFILHPPIYTLNADLFGPYAGVAQGTTSSFFALAGILSPGITGWLSDLTGNFHSGFFLVVGLSLSTSLMILFFQKPDREVRMA